MSKILVLEYDDFHWKSPENCLDTIYKFVKKYPFIKLSMFTVARHSGFEISQDEAWCGKVAELVNEGNLQLAVHGHWHTQEEFKNKTYEEAYNALYKAELDFEDADLPFVRVFRGPHWGINQNTYDALKSLGYTYVYTHSDYSELTHANEDGIKNIIYNWNLKDEPPLESFALIYDGQPTYIGHGHTHSVCQNGIAETFDRVCNFIDNNEVEFRFVNEI